MIDQAIDEDFEPQLIFDPYVQDFRLDIYMALLVHRKH